jgi:hypothetical protein
MSGHDRHLCQHCLADEYGTFVHTCVHESMDKNAAWFEEFKIEACPWKYSLEDCSLTFSEGGRPKVICAVRAVGSVQDDSWQWSWGNRNLPDSCKNRMDEVRSFGEQKQWPNLTTLFLKSDEYLGWELAAATNHILGGTGVYRCPDKENPGYFMYLVILSSQFVQ